MKSTKTSIMSLVMLIAALALALPGCSDDSSGKKDSGGSGGDGKVADSKVTDSKVSDSKVSDSAPATDSGGDTGSATGKKVKLVTTLGDILLELNATKAPKTVTNFLSYVTSKHYDGTIFHRVMKTFMIQGGGYDTSLTQKSTNAPIQNEADNGLSNLKYTIAMARTTAPHTATAQFFINVVDNPGLNHKAKTTSGWGYAVFGKVVVGMDTVDKIRDVKTAAQGMHLYVPVTTVEIKSATVVK